VVKNTGSSLYQFSGSLTMAAACLCTGPIAVLNQLFLHNKRNIISFIGENEPKTTKIIDIMFRYH
jgi:hypothetical protein